MRTIGSGLLAHLQGSTTTIATLVRVERADGEVFGFTDHDADLFFDGLLYKCSSAVSASAFSSSSALRQDSVEIVGALDAAAISAEDLASGLWDFAQIQIRLVNWADLSQGAVYVSRGELGRVTRRGGTFVAELLGLMLRLQRSVGRQILPTCDVKQLGDARCGVSLSTFTHSDTITAVASRYQFTSAGLAQAAGYFRRGVVTFDSGACAGRTMNVSEHATGGVITLDEDAPADLAVGDDFTIIAGCDRTRETCSATFDNIVNFRGFPDVPGRDKLIRAEI